MHILPAWKKFVNAIIKVEFIVILWYSFIFFGIILDSFAFSGIIGYFLRIFDILLDTLKFLRLSGDFRKKKKRDSKWRQVQSKIQLHCTTQFCLTESINFSRSWAAWQKIPFGNNFEFFLTLMYMLNIFMSWELGFTCPESGKILFLVGSNLHGIWF